MRKIIAGLIAAGLAAGVSFTAAGASPDTAPETVAVGQFHTGLHGHSRFAEHPDGTVVLRGNYHGLDPDRAFYTVVYGNRVCDPAQAFPIGPFTTDNQGDARPVITVHDPSGRIVAGTQSISIRYADTDAHGNPTDQDGDGKTGADDVVAVPGQPSIGLRECDPTPTVRP